MLIYSHPKDYEKKQSLFEIRANGRRIEAYGCRVSAVAYNHVWQGKQRSLSQTREAAFVTLGNDGETVLEITPTSPFSSVCVRPSAKKIPVTVDGNTVTVKFPTHGQYTVEFDGFARALAVFINPEKDFSTLRSQENVLYFAPGVHRLDERILLQDGQTVYLDEGAVLYGSINAVGKKDIRVVGYGILDNGRMQRQDALQSTPEILKEKAGIGLPIYFDRCENVSVEGITIVDSSEWSMKYTGCKNVCVENVKLIGMWRYNADGCDFCNCINATIRNSFLRTFDDCIVVKGLNSNRETPVRNVLAENCVLWCDWGRCIEVGAETCAPYMRDMTFRNCYLIHGSDMMLDVQQGDRSNIENVRFEDLEIEYTGDEQKLAIQTEDEAEYPYFGVKHTPKLFTLVSGVTMWSHDDRAGDICSVYFRNVNVVTADGSVPQNSFIGTREAQSKIDGVYFENIVVNGKKRTLKELGVIVKGNVSNVSET